MISLEVIGSKGSEGSSNEPINASDIISFGAPKNL